MERTPEIIAYQAFFRTQDGQERQRPDMQAAFGRQGIINRRHGTERNATL
jgi:hypothetical protein